jgi:hypothetical protein
MYDPSREDGGSSRGILVNRNEVRRIGQRNQTKKKGKKGNQAQNELPQFLVEKNLKK